MLDKIKAQYKSGKTMNQARYFGLMRRNTQIPMIQEIYPYAIDYYHELNPYFLTNLQRMDLFDFCNVLTVRDGSIPFASFIAQNMYLLEKYDTALIIHPDLAYLVPERHKHRFLSWKIVQKNKSSIKEAERVLVSGLMNEECIGPLAAVEKKLSSLKEVKADTEIEFYLPVRKNPLEPNWKETYIFYEVIELIKQNLPDRKLHFLTARELMNKNAFTKTYHLELFPGTRIVADKGLTHYLASRGAWVEEFQEETPKDSLFEVDLGFNHSLHITPLPKVTSIFTDLLFYRKLNPGTDLLTDKSFHKIIHEK